MAMTDKVMTFLKNEVKEDVKININPIYFEAEDDNQTCFFEVEDTNEMIVVNSIHQIGDFACGFDIPKVIDGEWVNLYD